MKSFRLNFRVRGRVGNVPKLTQLPYRFQLENVMKPSICGSTILSAIMFSNFESFFYMWMRSNPDPAALRLRRKTERLRRPAAADCLRQYKTIFDENRNVPKIKTLVSG